MRAPGVGREAVVRERRGLHASEVIGIALRLLAQRVL